MSPGEEHVLCLPAVFALSCLCSVPVLTGSVGPGGRRAWGMLRAAVSCPVRVFLLLVRLSGPERLCCLCWVMLLFHCRAAVRSLSRLLWLVLMFVCCLFKSYGKIHVT